MKSRVSFGLMLLSVALTACRQDLPPVINQTAPPTVSATVAPSVAVANNVNSAHADNAAQRDFNQTVKPTPTASATPKPSVSPTAAAPKVTGNTKLKNYDGKGVVKKINVENGSIFIDHEDIGDYMIAMKMPFTVADRKILDGLKVGDRATFVLETGAGVERIIKIEKR